MSCCAELIALALAAGAAAAPVRLPVTADTSVCAHPAERSLNAGAAPRLKLKGIENLILLAFDPAAVRGRIVRRATLRLTATDKRAMVRWVGISTVGADWSEGGGTYTPDGNGTTFLFPGGRGQIWGGDGATMLDAVFGRGGTFWTRTVAARREGNVYEIPVEGRFIEAVAAGLSAGLALSDDNGQTMHMLPGIVPASNRSNNYFFSREQSSARPVLTVEPADAPAVADLADIAVSVVPSAHGASPGSGGAEVAWEIPDTAGEVLGVSLRVGQGERAALALPRRMLPGTAGPRRMIMPNLPPGGPVAFEVEAIGRAGRIVARGRGMGFASAKLDLPRPIAVPILNEPRSPADDVSKPGIRLFPDLVRVHPVSGEPLERVQTPFPAANGVALGAARGEWVAFQVVCDQPPGGPREWRVAVGPLSGPGGTKLPADRVRLFRVTYVKTGDAPGDRWGDPLVPLPADGAFTFPAGPDAAPGQTNQTIYVEVFVPPDAKPGRYAGSLAVSAGGEKLPGVPIRVEVAAAVLPARASFTFSLNAYDTPGGDAERALYALAHDHRTTLAILHYSHSGNYADGCVPPVTGTGGSAKVADWSGFDARFGPLLDGSAFAGTSRPGIGLDHFYLALCEHYPVPMAEGYRWNTLRWEDHWKSAGTVQNGFTPAMQEAWVAVAREYANHVKEKGWPAAFQVYLNDKYFYKQVDPKTRKPGTGVSFWLLDEPVHADDFLALRFFGDLLRRATADAQSPLVFRADVSRPEWGRDLLDDVLDVNVSGAWPDQARLLAGWKALHDQEIWTYGDTPSAATSALAIPAQALDLWVHGIDGYVPWQVLGGPEHWATHATTAVILPGAPRGIAGPVATLRLKAYRRAAQDVELLKLHAAKQGWLADDPRRLRAAALLRDVLPARARAGSLDDQGAAVFSYDAVTAAALEAFRAHVRGAP